ncbi:MAG: TilS substrate-binding domain-containing protein [Chthoniobacteraceae bacterium]
MSTAQIIEEIKQLPPGEQREVIQEAYRLDAGRMLSGEEIGKLAERMVAATDPAEELLWRDAILRGFYGRSVDA